MHRSYLYCPADQPDRLSGALGRGADVVIIDLEDGVAASAKPEARGHAARFLSERRSDLSPALMVRVNASEASRDLDALRDVANVCSGWYLPKATIGSVEVFASLLRSMLGDHPAPIVALIESAQGVLDAPAIARHGNVTNLALGEADLRADLGMAPSPDGSEFLPIRSAIVVASAAARIASPTAPASTDFRDLDAFRASCVELRALGFGARSCVHPAQVPIVAEVFEPSAEELDRARAMITAFDDALTRGEGVLVDDAGRMVDEAVVRHARNLLS